HQLMPGVTLVYRQNESAQLFTLTGAAEGGLRAEDPQTVGLNYSIAGLLAAAGERRGFAEMMTLVEGKRAVLQGFSGKDSFGFHVQSLPEHTDILLDAFAEVLLTPVFPEEQWQSLKREIEQAIATQDDAPSGIAVRAFQKKIYGQHPYRFPLYGT